MHPERLQMMQQQQQQQQAVRPGPEHFPAPFAAPPASDSQDDGMCLTPVSNAPVFLLPELHRNLPVTTIACLYEHKSFSSAHPR